MPQQDITKALERYTPGARGGRERRLRQEYGIGEAVYASLLRSQGGVCAICHEIESVQGSSGQMQPLCVDHDHATGRVRGLLCSSCNAGLGHYHDEPNRLRAAATYLEHGGTASAAHQPSRR